MPCSRLNRQFYHGGDMVSGLTTASRPRCAKEGVLDAMFFSLFVTEQYYPRVSSEAGLRLIDAAYAQLARNKDKIELALQRVGHRAHQQEGKIAAFRSRGGFDLDGDLGVFAICIVSACAPSSFRAQLGQ